LSKPEVAAQVGAEIVQSWRSGLNSRPPPMQSDHPYWHHSERKYSDLAYHEIPVTESLQDTIERTLPLWDSRILPELRNGNNVLIVAHGNSLRGIVKHIESLSSDEIRHVGIPNGIPLVYKFDKDMRPIPQPNAVSPVSGQFLEKKGLLRAALEREAELAKNVPGYILPTNSSKFSRPQLDSFLLGLSKLDQVRYCDYFLFLLEF
jgi:2,3-bisphosphoglycerate-dependent phosphoglycerate mutase